MEITQQHVTEAREFAKILANVAALKYYLGNLCERLQENPDDKKLNCQIDHVQEVLEDTMVKLHVYSKQISANHPGIEDVAEQVVKIRDC